MASPKSADDWESVETQADFLELVGLLAQDWESDEAKRLARKDAGHWASEGERWAHGTPGAWLQAMHAWFTDLAESSTATPLDTDPPSWRTFAFVLSASRYYE